MRHRRNRAIALLLSAAALAAVSGAASAQNACTYPASGTYAIQLTSDQVPGPAYQTRIVVLGWAESASAIHQVMTIDTGSTGIVISQKAVPPAVLAQAKTLRQILYTSSDDFLVGRDVTAAIQLPLVGGGTVETNPIPMMAAACSCGVAKGTKPTKSMPTDVAALENCANFNGAPSTQGDTGNSLQHCHITPPGVGMMGVGFDRGGQSSATNAFLNLAPKGVHPGYVISKSGIQVGLTQGNTAGFKTLQLAKSQTPDSAAPTPNWVQPTGCVTLTAPGASAAPAPLCGSTLVDTGIDYMFTTFPADVRPAGSVTAGAYPFDGSMRQIVTPGWSIRFTMTPPSGTAPIVDYTLTAAQTPPAKVALAPVPVPVGSTVGVWATPQTPPGDINTGRRLLYAADYMFDAQCGRYGFRQPPQ